MAHGGTQQQFPQPTKNPLLTPEVIQQMMLFKSQCKYVCSECGKWFVSGGGLYKHKKINHGRSEDLIPCPECDQKFVTQSALKRHMPRHSSERPHACHICGKSYKHKDALVGHPCR